MLDNLALGFDVALSLNNLLYCLFGVTIATLVGVLPGIGPLAVISMLLPITFGLDPSSQPILTFAGGLSTATKRSAIICTRSVLSSTISSKPQGRTCFPHLRGVD